MADSLNHANMNLQYELFSKKLHLSKQSINTKGYFTKSKLKMNYSDVYKDGDEEEIKASLKGESPTPSSDEPVYKMVPELGVALLESDFSKLNLEDNPFDIWDL